MGSMDGYRDMLERERDYAYRQLGSQAADIASDLGRIAERIGSGEQVIINDLGELQSRGSRFDIACSRYDRARRALDDYDAFAAEDS
jgi:hypothetical protein